MFSLAGLFAQPGLVVSRRMSKPFPRIAAVDYGTKRVGLAMTDPLRMFVQPIGTFSPDAALARLDELHATDGIETIVVGWPLTENDEEGKATRRVEPYFGRLKNAFRNVNVVQQDERHTSKRAAHALVAAGVKKKARREKGRLDAASAVLILEDYLEEHGSVQSGHS